MKKLLLVSALAIAMLSCNTPQPTTTPTTNATDTVRSNTTTDTTRQQP